MFLLPFFRRFCALLTLSIIHDVAIDVNTFFTFSATFFSCVAGLVSQRTQGLDHVCVGHASRVTTQPLVQAFALGFIDLHPVDLSEHVTALAEGLVLLDGFSGEVGEGIQSEGVVLVLLSHDPSGDVHHCGYFLSVCPVYVYYYKA